eukprot:CAMPEP_0171020932 /NCGR_PEP_ID=MMETSP0736-20130129/30282_1 /TAXON_ID=186038 /ORGANISM="Fragilariopsis kerguelensis, Strain L26-C5" /LENGTH=314 /DNA_ID=CAMNT_0011458973 /DNA_START=21 /DNA_END=965 /DNA_ORIENTATION=+
MSPTPASVPPTAAPTDASTTKSTAKLVTIAGDSTAAATTPTTSTAKKSSGTKSSAKTVTKATGAGMKAKKPARKKKTTTKSLSSSSSNSQVYAQARAAQLDLTSQRNTAAIRLSDPLWYKLEDYVLPAVADESVMSGDVSAKILPEQVKIVEAALDKNGLTRCDVTPQAFNRVEITKADLALASEFRPDLHTSITTQLPKLNLLAQSINRVPLPPIPTQCYSGVLLPSKRYQLTARTFDVVTSAQTAQRMVQAVPTVSSQTKVNNSSNNQSSNRRGSSNPSFKKNTSKKMRPSYGAARGRQIGINYTGECDSSK